MTLLYLLHIGAGALGLLTGYVALFSAKGGPRHRRVVHNLVTVTRLPSPVSRPPTLA